MELDRKSQAAGETPGGGIGEMPGKAAARRSRKEFVFACEFCAGTGYEYASTDGSERYGQARPVGSYAMAKCRLIEAHRKAADEADSNA